jgi:hypothetical protein
MAGNRRPLFVLLADRLDLEGLAAIVREPPRISRDDQVLEQAHEFFAFGLGRPAPIAAQYEAADRLDVEAGCQQLAKGLLAARAAQVPVGQNADHLGAEFAYEYRRIAEFRGTRRARRAQGHQGDHADNRETAREPAPGNGLSYLLGHGHSP